MRALPLRERCSRLERRVVEAKILESKPEYPVDQFELVEVLGLLLDPAEPVAAPQWP
jgi:hypothetical protein